jgi:hypothetical protein
MELAHFVHRPFRPRAAQLPAPWVPAVLCCGPAAATFGFGFAAGLAGTNLLVAPISVALLGVFLTARRFVVRARLRAAADEWIALRFGGPATRYGWRTEELTSPRERRLLAGSLRRVVRELDAPHRHVGSLLNRRTMRPQRDLLSELADRLADGDRPVSASGIVAVQRLLTRPDSPLYAYSGPDGPVRDTRAELGAVLDRLEVRR